MLQELASAVNTTHDCRRGQNLHGLDKPKIAFMFLMEKHFEMFHIWNAFLLSAPSDEWSMHIHLPPGARSSNFFQKFVLDEDERLPTEWCGDLISPVVNLMHEALKDPANAMFVLVSPKDIPVKPFALLRSLLLRDQNAWVCLWDLWTWSSWNAGAEQPKHHQWFAFTRTGAQNQVDRPHPRMRPRHGCWDENWIAPPAMDISQSAVEVQGRRPWPGVNYGSLHTRQVPAFYGRCMTYVMCPFRAVEDHFHDTRVAGRRRLGPISLCTLEYLRDHTDFLFARKVLPGVKVSYACSGDTHGQQSVSHALKDLEVLQ